MQATEILTDEHRVIERVLVAMTIAANRAEAGEAIDPSFFIKASDFIRGFADGCHHRKEEGVLFVAMVDAGMPRDGGPIAAMLDQHEQGRRYTMAMRQAAERWADGDESMRGETVRNARAYVDLLQGHIQREDHILFPLADRAIPPDAQGKVADDFERVEHEETGEGVHEKYLALAEELEREARA